MIKLIKSMYYHLGMGVLNLKKWRAQICVLFLFLSVFIGGAEAQNSDQYKALVNTNAAKAFIARDYHQALVLFNELANEQPYNLSIKRYQALSLDRLERSDEAIEILKEILLVSTESAATHYHLATIYYKLQQAELAEQHFTEVISLAQGSKYDELAQVYLDAIADQRFNFLKPGAPKKWGIYASLGVTDELGSRVDFSGEDRSGNRTSAYISVNYYYLRNHQWTGTVGLSAFRSEHSHSSYDDSDFKQWGFRTTLQKQTQLLGKPTIHRFSLNYRNIEFGRRDYSDGFSGSLNTRIRLTKNTATNFYFAYGQEKYDPLITFDPEFFLTRQDNYYAGVEHSVYLKNRTIELGVGAFGNIIDANTDNFNREGFGGRVFARFTLPYKLRLRLSATYRDDSYPDFQGVGNRDFDSIYYGVGVSRRLTKHFSLNLIYRKYDIDYSSDFGGIDNSSVGLNLSYVY